MRALSSQVPGAAERCYGGGVGAGGWAMYGEAGEKFECADAGRGARCLITPGQDGRRRGEARAVGRASSARRGSKRGTRGTWKGADEGGSEGCENGGRGRTAGRRARCGGRGRRVRGRGRGLGGEERRELCTLRESKGHYRGIAVKLPLPFFFNSILYFIFFLSLIRKIRVFISVKYSFFSYSYPHSRSRPRSRR